MNEKNEDLSFKNIVIGEFEKIGEAFKNKSGYVITIWGIYKFFT